MDDAREMQAWLEAVWTEREERVYRGLFGDLGPGVFAAGERPFARIGRPAVHAGWHHHGVFACPPHGERRAWLYVTSGLSNPWNLDRPERDPSGHSGLGFELCLFAPHDSVWAVELLHNLMAWQLLVGTGSVTGRPLDKGQRVPLGGSITGVPDSLLTWVLVEAPDLLPPSFELASGACDFLLLVGASEAEVQWARARDQQALVRRLREHGAFPVTDAGRPSLA